jgi:hypothetical protein
VKEDGKLGKCKRCLGRERLSTRFEVQIKYDDTAINTVLVAIALISRVRERPNRVSHYSDYPRELYTAYWHSTVQIDALVLAWKQLPGYKIS